MTVAKHGVSADTQKRLLIDAGAVYLGFKSVDNPGTLLGATRGGNVFELTRTIRRMEADGARGPVKGMRRLEEVVATIRANMMELTAENFRRSIADAIYSSGTTDVEAEAVGTGDDETTEFPLDYALVEENSEIVKLDGEAQTRLTDYTMDYAAGKIQFVVAPGIDVVITADYTYISGDAVIGGETTEAYLAIIKDAAYIDSVAIVGTISDPLLPGDSQPIICKIENALCDTAFSLTLAPKNEAVPEVTFTAHYLPDYLDTEPWSITYPSD